MLRMAELFIPWEQFRMPKRKETEMTVYLKAENDLRKCCGWERVISH